MQVSIFLSLLFSRSYTLSRMGLVPENSPLGAGFKQITFTNGKDFEKRVIKEVASNRLVLNQIKTK